jgi:predicted nucleic acid-binding protein
VLIWYLRGNKNAKDLVDKNIPFAISAITYMELIQGMRDKQELSLFKKYMERWSVEIIPVDKSICAKAMYFVETYFLSHSLELTDAMIAATALEKQEPLITGNEKHYRFIPDIQLNVFKP